MKKCTKIVILPPATYRALRGDYGLHNRSITQAIVVTNIERPEHYPFARSAENIAIVSESIVKTRMCGFLVVLKN